MKIGVSFLLLMVIYACSVTCLPDPPPDPPVGGEGGQAGLADCVCIDRMRIRPGSMAYKEC